MSINATRDATYLSNCLRRTISDRVTVVGTDSRTGLGINEDFFIETEHHIVPNKFDYRVDYTLSPVSAYGQQWVLNTSRLGIETALHY